MRGYGEKESGETKLNLKEEESKNSQRLEDPLQREGGSPMIHKSLPFQLLLLAIFLYQLLQYNYLIYTTLQDQNDTLFSTTFLLTFNYSSDQNLPCNLPVTRIILILL